MIELLMPLLEKFGKDLSPGRMFESFVLLAVIWSRLKPHLKKIEERLEGLEGGVKTGFESGSKRFHAIELRLEILERERNLE